MENYQVVKIIEKSFRAKKDNDYRAGFLDAIMKVGLVTERQWLELRQLYTDIYYKKHDRRLRRIGE